MTERNKTETPEVNRPDTGPETDSSSTEYAQRVEWREPSRAFREAVERNLRMGRAAATATKKK